MSVILILILASLVVALLFLGGFIWAVKSGQFEDTCTPSMRILTDDDPGSRRDGLSATQPNAKPHESSTTRIPGR